MILLIMLERSKYNQLYFCTLQLVKNLYDNRSFQDEQADEWLQLKVDTNKAHKPSKLICQKKYNLYFSGNVGDYL